MSVAVLGPSWSVRPDAPADTGRQPLAVEAVTGAHAAALIPGVITTTPDARYLALHARLAIEAERRGWDAANDLDGFRGLVLSGPEQLAPRAGRRPQRTVKPGVLLSD